MKYSIIVPIYNIERFLRKCIESIVSQTYSNIEIILVDDGSTDGSASICDEYEKCYSKIKVLHKENGGLVSARQAGARISSGDYILCVDGDDWISEDYVEQFNNVISEYNPDIICCGYVQVYDEYEDKHFIKSRNGFYTQEEINKEIFPILISGKDGSSFEPTVWAKAFRRELYLRYQNLVNPRIKIGEDGACTIPCIIDAQSLYIIPKCTYYYRFNTNSMTKERNAFSWEGIHEIYKHLSSVIDMREEDFQEQFSRRIIHSLFNVAVSQFYMRESYKEICKIINKELKYREFDLIIHTHKINGSKKLFFAWIALKYRLYFIMKMYSLIK